MFLFIGEDAEEYQINVERSKNSAEKNDVSREAEVLTLGELKISQYKSILIVYNLFFFF